MSYVIRCALQIVLSLSVLACLPAWAATLTVTTNGEIGAADPLFRTHCTLIGNDRMCATLRDALTSAASGDVIQFAAALDGQTITLNRYTNCLSAADVGSATCLPPIDGWSTGTVTQFGASAFFIGANKVITIDATANGLLYGITIARSSAAGTADFRLFDVETGSALALKGVSLSNGIARGGTSGSGGGALGAGGAVFNRGRLTIERGTLYANQARGGNADATTNAGGAGAGQNGQGNAGGGPNGGVNSAGGGFGGGGAVFAGGGFGGGGGSSGGGGFGGGGGVNGSRGFGGGDNGGGGAGLGGAVFNDAGSLTLANVTLSANTAGGGTSTGGNNGRGLGGAVFNYNGKARLSFTTFAGNTVTGDTDADHKAQGSSIYSLGDTAANCAAGGNPCLAPGSLGASGSAALTLVNSVAVGGSANAGEIAIDTTIPPGTPGGSTAPSTASGNGNFIASLLALPGADTSGLSAVSTVPALLGPLADHAGYGLTALPQTGSPLIDAAIDCKDASGNIVATDQRGVVRPFGAQCDIGAVELRSGTLRLEVRVFGLGTVSAATSPAPILSPGIAACNDDGTNCSATYDSDNETAAGVIALTATPDSEALFAGWSGACSGTAASTKIFLGAPVTICEATFLRKNDPGIWTVQTANEPATLDGTDCTPYAHQNGGTCLTLRGAMNNAISGDTVAFAAGLDGQTINLTRYTNCLSKDQPVGDTCLPRSSGWPASGATQFGPSAFFVGANKFVTIDATLNGLLRGVTIARSSAASTAKFRLFDVETGSGLTLKGVSLKNGRAEGGSSTYFRGGYGGGAGGGGALGAGGAIFNRGSLHIEQGAVYANSAQGGAVNDSGVDVGGAGSGGGGAGANSDGASAGGPNVNPGNSGGFGGGGAGVGSGGFGGGGGGPAVATHNADGFNGGGGGFGGGGGGGGGAPYPRSASGPYGDAIGGNGAAGGFGGGNGANFFSHGQEGNTDAGGGDGGGGGGLGGAIFNDAGSLSLVNVTLNGNSASGGASDAQPGSGMGGAIFNYNGKLTLRFVTLAANTVASGSADGTSIYSLGDSAAACGAGGNPCLAPGASTPGNSADFSMFNSVAVGGSGGANELVMDRIHIGSGNDSQSFSGGDSNVIRSYAGKNGVFMGSWAPAGNPAGGMNLLGPLSDNGGYGPTMLPVPALPGLIEQGACYLDNQLVAATDQRGVARPQSLNCDIGAAELRLYPLTVTIAAEGVTPGTVSDVAPPAPLYASRTIVNCAAGAILFDHCVGDYVGEGPGTPMTVTLAATSLPGSHVYWSDACTVDPANPNRATVTMNQAQNCTATFLPNLHTLGGTITGYAGSGLKLFHADTGLPFDDLLVVPAGASGFMFAYPVAYGDDWTVSVAAQPTNPSQTCSVNPSSGTMPDADVNDLLVTCTTNTYTIGGTVTGLAGSGLSVSLNGTQILPIGANGNFVFPAALASGTAYAVTVATQPASPTQTCTVSNGGGTLAGANIANVQITCATNTYTVGGAVSGLTGGGLVLSLNGAAQTLAVGASGTFTFAGPLPSGSTYAVTIATQPASPAQACTVSDGVGTVTNANITGIVVLCATNHYSVGGTVVGLSGSGLVLNDNGGDPLPIAADGNFTFATTLASGASFNVTVDAQPTSPSQTCVVSGGSGTVANADVTGIVVNCTANTYTVGGTVSGLAGSGLALKLDSQTLTISADGNFIFPAPLASGTPYAVSVSAQPQSPAQTCAIAHDSGTVTSADIADVQVTCTTNAYHIGGTVSGLAGNGLTLSLNAGAQTATIAADGNFAFASPMPSGAAYSVVVSVQPALPTQTCTVIHASGTVAAADIVDISVQCTTSSFTIGGTIGGLSGTGLVLSLNSGAQTLTVDANGHFTFANPLPSGTTYSVDITTQPLLPTQTCSVSSGDGTVTNAPITGIVVNCATNSFTIGGIVGGLQGSGLTLSLNGGAQTLPIGADGSFTFPAALPSGSAYAASVSTQPASPAQTCIVSRGNGSVHGGNVSNIKVTCTTNRYPVGGTVGGLAGGSVVLRLNGGAQSVVVPANGSFSFPTPLVSGSNYAVDVQAQPVYPSQTCAVASGSGNVTNAAVTGIVVNCGTNAYTIGGTVSGLAGGSVTLRLNDGAQLLTVASNGSFTFPAALASGNIYAVDVQAQPANPSQTCSVVAGDGIVVDAAITGVAVACSTNTYTVGGTIVNLAGSGLVLQLNGSADLSVAADATSFVFPALADLSSYAVTVSTQPSSPAQACSVSNASGTLAGANVTSVIVTCTTRAALTLVSSLNPSSFGSAVTFTATLANEASANSRPVSATDAAEAAAAAASADSIVFSDGATVLASVALVNSSASYTTSALTPGSHVINAVHAANGTTGAASATITQTVNAAGSQAVPAPALSIPAMLLLGLALACAGASTRRLRGGPNRRGSRTKRN